MKKNLLKEKERTKPTEREREEKQHLLEEKERKIYIKRLREKTY